MPGDTQPIKGSGSFVHQSLPLHMLFNVNLVEVNATWWHEIAWNTGKFTSLTYISGSQELLRYPLLPTVIRMSNVSSLVLN